MARKSSKPESISLIRSWRPYLLPSLTVTFLALAMLVAFYRWERFLLQDYRFQLRKPELGERTSPDLRIGGISHTQPAQVRAVFLEDEGRSVYLMPLEKRREQLLDLKWIRQASVSRVWPNRVDVRVLERIPVAFVQVIPERRSPAPQVQLIDDTGEFLPLPEGRKYTLPVLVGIRERHSRTDRVERIHLMQRLLAELGPAGKPISEIDVSEPNNVKVIYPTEDRALTLVLGDEEWKQRLDKFLRNYPKIREKMPKAIKLDLRIRDRITAMETDEGDHAE